MAAGIMLFMAEYPFFKRIGKDGEVWEISEGTNLLGVHSGDECKGRHCVLHNPSGHHMRGWLLHWRGDRGIFERICEHGVGHPDPDQNEYWENLGQEWQSLHGCDGCCSDPYSLVADSILSSATESAAENVRATPNVEKYTEEEWQTIQKIADEAITTASLADQAKRTLRLEYLSRRLNRAVEMRCKITLDEYETSEIARMLDRELSTNG